MPLIAAIRQAERWTAVDIAGGLFLLGVLIVLAVWLLRRYLSD